MALCYWPLAYTASKKNDYTTEKEEAEAQAAELKHIIPQSMTLDEELTEDQNKPKGKTISFSLFTTPAGADVYLDSNFIGKTPIDMIQMDKSQDEHKLIISLEGYDITRQNITFNDNYSDFITLNEKVVAQVKTNDNQDGALSDTVFQNKGVIVNQQVAKNKKGSKGKKDSAAAPVVTGIALPD